MWQELVGNLAIVALSVFGWEVLSLRLEFWPARRRHILFAGVMGACSIASMVFSVHLHDGVIFDLRSSLIVISGFFGGPLAGLVCGAIAGAYRAWVGGAGMSAGLVVIALAVSAGVVANLLVKRRPDSVLHIVILSLAAADATLIGFSLVPAPLGAEAMRQFGVPVFGLTVVATFVSGIIMLQGRRMSDERRLLKAALHQSPDFQFIKNRQSQFIVVNQHVADSNGFADPAGMRGLTDFDLFPVARAEQLFKEEQHVLATGRPLTEHVEAVVDASGNQRWYSTSKSVVVGRDGEVIGLTGVTHDITERKRIEAELLHSRNLLSNALAGMSDGLAMFDADDVLMFCNEQYREIFSLTAAVRVTGTPLRTILQAVVETGEQLGIPEDDAESWIDHVIATVHETAEREVNLKNGHWVRVRTRRTSDGISIVTVSDITQAKLAQEALLTLTDQLKSLAGTDGLTGLPNRRAFDQALLNELVITTRAREPLSLLIIDVDYFKPYNDVYGHLAGDDCLKAISRCLQRVVRQPRIVAARFGGEEFVLILPATDEEGASIVAEEIRDLLAELAIPHSGNKPPIVTVSIGIASYAARGSKRSAADILRRADEALYQAKHAGRNRTVVWQAESADISISAA